MKKQVCAMLAALCLAAFGRAAHAAVECFDFLNEIPGGIGEEECVERIATEAGCTYERIVYYQWDEESRRVPVDNGESFFYRLQAPPELRVFGQPAEVDISFARNVLDGAAAHFMDEGIVRGSESAAEAYLAQRLSLYLELLEQLDALYGGPSTGWVQAWSEDHVDTYDYPMREGVRDREALLRILCSPSEGDVTLFEKYGELGLAIVRGSYTNDEGSYLCANLSLLWNKGDKTISVSDVPFRGEKGPYPAEGVAAQR